MTLYNTFGKQAEQSIWPKLHYISLGITMALYALALFMPALETKKELLRGSDLLLYGIFSIISDLSLFFIWLSNLLFFISLALNLGRVFHPLVLLLSLIATILGCLMMVKGEIVGDIDIPIVHYHWGYYAWIASYVGSLLSSLIGLGARKSVKRVAGWGTKP